MPRADQILAHGLGMARWPKASSNQSRRRQCFPDISGGPVPPFATHLFLPFGIHHTLAGRNGPTWAVVSTQADRAPRGKGVPVFDKILFAKIGWAPKFEGEVYTGNFRS